MQSATATPLQICSCDRKTTADLLLRLQTRCRFAFAATKPLPNRSCSREIPADSPPQSQERCGFRAATTKLLRICSLRVSSCNHKAAACSWSQLGDCCSVNLERVWDGRRKFAVVVVRPLEIHSCDGTSTATLQLRSHECCRSVLALTKPPQICSYDRKPADLQSQPQGCRDYDCKTAANWCLPSQNRRLFAVATICNRRRLVCHRKTSTNVFTSAKLLQTCLPSQTRSKLLFAISKLLQICACDPKTTPNLHLQSQTRSKFAPATPNPLQIGICRPKLAPNLCLQSQTRSKLASAVPNPLQICACDPKSAPN